MRWFVFWCVLAWFPAFTQAQKLELCYFDLSGQPDNKFLMENLQIVENEENISIHANAPEKNANINEAFKNWVTNNKDKNCSGLIFSGYHTGGHFHQEGGDTEGNKNKLSLSLIERLACDEDLKEWFGNVKQLWLFGSYTVRDKYLKSTREGKHKDQRKAGTKTGDKLAAPLTKPDSDGEHTYANLQQTGLSFAHALDEGTPLSSRYMRAFPNTNIYGWSDEAPTSHQIETNWGKTHPIFTQIKLIGEAELAKESNADAKSKDKQTVIKGIEVLARGDYCNEEWKAIMDGKEDITEGVKKKNYGQAARLGCDLINAQKALETAEETCKKHNPNPKTKIGKQRRCEKKIINEAQEKIIETLKEINEKEAEIAEARKTGQTDVIKEYLGEAGIEDKTLSLSHLLFNEINSAYLTARNKSNKLLSDNEIKKFSNDFKTTLDKDSPIITALQEKVKSPVLSTVRKVDYIKFYKALHGQNKSDEKDFVTTSVQTIINEKLKCAYWKPIDDDGNCPPAKVATTKKVTTDGKTKEELISNESLLGVGRGDAKITLKHHYTLTAVVSDQLKQYGLLSDDQAEQLKDVLDKTSNKTPYIQQITDCLTESDFRTFRQCKAKLNP